MRILRLEIAGIILRIMYRHDSAASVPVVNTSNLVSQTCEEQNFSVTLGCCGTQQLGFSSEVTAREHVMINTMFQCSLIPRILPRSFVGGT